MFDIGVNARLDVHVVKKKKVNKKDKKQKQTSVLPQATQPQMPTDYLPGISNVYVISLSWQQVERTGGQQHSISISITLYYERPLTKRKTNRSS